MNLHSTISYDNETNTDLGRGGVGTNLDQLYTGYCLLRAKRCKTFKRKLLIVNQFLAVTDSVLVTHSKLS